MRYTLGTAAKATGKTKTTIQRAISKGKISAEKLNNGGYSIDPSELHRVFPPLSNDMVSCDSKLDTTRPQDETPGLRVKTATLEAENAALRAALDREREALDEVRTDRDAWKKQASALLAAPSGAARKKGDPTLPVAFAALFAAALAALTGWLTMKDPLMGWISILLGGALLVMSLAIVYRIRSSTRL